MLYPLSYEGGTPEDGDAVCDPSAPPGPLPNRLRGPHGPGGTIADSCRQADRALRDTSAPSASTPRSIPRTTGPAQARRFSTNVAMATAKAAGRNPVSSPSSSPARSADPPRHVPAVERSPGPGFSNGRLDPAWLHELIGTAVDAGADYGRSDVARRHPGLMVEYVSANPTGPVRRSARVSTATAWPGCCASSADVPTSSTSTTAACRCRPSPLLPAHWAGSRQGRHTAASTSSTGRRDADGADPLREWGEAHAPAINGGCPPGVEFDTWFSERSLPASGAIADTLDDLRERDAWSRSARGRVWLRSTVFGDDKDRCSSRATASTPYLLPDIAYPARQVRLRLRPGHQRGKRDHHGYAPHEGCHPGPRHDQPTSRSSSPSSSDWSVTAGGPRSPSGPGDLITLEDLIDEGRRRCRAPHLPAVPVDSRPRPSIWDPDRQQSNENPVFYVQMANARIASIARVAAEAGIRTPPPGRGRPVAAHRRARRLEVLRQLDVLGEVVLPAPGRAPPGSPPGVQGWPLGPRLPRLPDPSPRHARPQLRQAAGGWPRRQGWAARRSGPPRRVGPGRM